MATRNKLSDRELANDKAKRIMNGVNAWCSFYRANPHRFCLDYLNIKLKLFQQIILYMMNWYDHTMYIAARGQGKTFLVAVFCCVRCILYPGTANDFCYCSSPFYSAACVGSLLSVALFGCIFSMVKILWEIHLHSLFSIPEIILGVCITSE